MRMQRAQRRGHEDGVAEVFELQREDFFRHEENKG